MKCGLFLLTILILLSCNKDKASSIQSALMAHSWLYDSLQVHDQNNPVTYVAIEPHTQLDFTSTNWIFIYRNQDGSGFSDTFTYALEKPSTIYKLYPDRLLNVYNEFKVEKVTNTALVLSHVSISNGFDQFEFYHAK